MEITTQSDVNAITECDFIITRVCIQEDGSVIVLGKNAIVPNRATKDNRN